MIIGTIRREEAKVFDSEAGTHTRHNGQQYEVYWSDEFGWGWYDIDNVAGFSGQGFARSNLARANADPVWRFLDSNPTMIAVVAERITLYEDPDEGDEATLWALSPSGQLAQTDFFEVDPAMDTEYFAELFSR